MTASIDRILEAIDVGLQESAEASYADPVPEGKCWRCLHHYADPESPSGVCVACREILLSDEPAPTTDEPQMVTFHGQFENFIGRFENFITECMMVFHTADLESTDDFAERSAQRCQAVWVRPNFSENLLADMMMDNLMQGTPLPWEAEPATIASPPRRSPHRPCPRHGDTSATSGMCRPCARGR